MNEYVTQADLDTLNPIELCALTSHYLNKRWTRTARPEQIPGAGNDSWIIHALLGGRGSGKTRPAAEWLTHHCLRYPNTRAGILNFDFEAVREVNFEGDSGILTLLPTPQLVTHQLGRHRLVFPNGSIIQGYSSKQPFKLRGPQWHCFWIDEPADLWESEQCFDNIRGGLRLPGPLPARMMITGTPRAIPIIQRLVKLCAENPNEYVRTRASMRDNEANLDPNTVREMYSSYAPGSNYYKQEIEGHLVRQAEGALWEQEWFDKYRVRYEQVPQLDILKVCIDPSDSDSPQGDECGMIVQGRAGQDVYVFGDHTLRGSTLTWTEQIAEVGELHGASRVLVESNFLGATATQLLGQVESTSGLHIDKVSAKGDKATRAAPVAALTEAGRIHMVEGAPGPGTALLEAECTTWEPGKTKRSPNRIDAFVHGVTDMLLLGGTGTSAGVRASKINRRPRQRRM